MLLKKKKEEISVNNIKLKLSSWQKICFYDHRSEHNIIGIVQIDTEQYVFFGKISLPTIAVVCYLEKLRTERYAPWRNFILKTHFTRNKFC